MATRSVKPKPEAATSFPTEELVAAAASFGVKPEVMAGALYGKKEATKAEAKALLEVFKKKEIKGAIN